MRWSQTKTLDRKTSQSCQSALMKTTRATLPQEETMNQDNQIKASTTDVTKTSVVGVNGLVNVDMYTLSNASLEKSTSHAQEAS